MALPGAQKLPRKAGRVHREASFAKSGLLDGKTPGAELAGVEGRPAPKVQGGAAPPGGLSFLLGNGSGQGTGSSPCSACSATSRGLTTASSSVARS